jgi:hypothetical protein
MCLQHRRCVPYHPRTASCKPAEHPISIATRSDPTGYGYHADFISGWVPTLLGNALQQCGDNVPDGDVNQCSVFSGLVQSNEQSNTCNLTATVNEQVFGSLGQLPGNNPVTGGP